MKKLLLVVTLCIYGFSIGQDTYDTSTEHTPQAPIPIELMAGNEWIMFQNLISKDFGKNDKLNYFNLVNYEVDHDSEVPPSFIIQSIFSYKLNNRFALGAGANLKAFGGFKPLLAGQYTKFNRKIGLVIQPSVELGHRGVAELFALFEWLPNIKKSWQPYFSIQGASSMTVSTKDHDFSYVNARLGLQVSSCRFGLALNSRFVGKDSHSEWNIGAFVSTLIF